MERPVHAESSMWRERHFRYLCLISYTHYDPKYARTFTQITMGISLRTSWDVRRGLDARLEISLVVGITLGVIGGLTVGLSGGLASGLATTIGSLLGLARGVSSPAHASRDVSRGGMDETPL